MQRILFALIVAAIAAPALADDTAGFYSGTTLGYTHVDNPTSLPLTTSHDWVLGGFIAYRFNDYFGVEGAYTGTGKFENATQSGKSDALSLAGVGFLPLGSSNFELYGRIGAAYSLGKSSKGGLEDANRFAPTYGLGLQYKVTPSISIRLGVDRYEGAVHDGPDTRHYNSDILGTTFVYHF